MILSYLQKQVHNEQLCINSSLPSPPFVSVSYFLGRQEQKWPSAIQPSSQHAFSLSHLSGFSSFSLHAFTNLLLFVIPPSVSPSSFAQTFIPSMLAVATMQRRLHLSVNHLLGFLNNPNINKI